MLPRGFPEGASPLKQTVWMRPGHVAASIRSGRDRVGRGGGAHGPPPRMKTPEIQCRHGFRR